MYHEVVSPENHQPATSDLKLTHLITMYHEVVSPENQQPATSDLTLIHICAIYLNIESAIMPHGS
jgi:hypothetical protein